MTGAMMGTFAPSREATQILIGADYGSLFAYMFRRFGFPQLGSDSHKELVSYVITTEMKGVYLDVSPRPSGIEHSFGYRLTNQINKMCHQERFEPYLTKRKAFLEWIEANNLGPVFEPFSPWTLKRIQPCIDEWNSTHPDPNPDGEEAEQKLFYTFYKEKWEKLWTEFSETYPDSEIKFDVNLHRDNFPDDSFRGKVNAALVNTIKDLLKPVYVRDVPINACGLFEDPEKIDWDNNPPEWPDYSHHAGKGLSSIVKSVIEKRK